jgi:hypothetical protein
VGGECSIRIRCTSFQLRRWSSSSSIMRRSPLNELTKYLEEGTSDTRHTHRKPDPPLY